MKVLVSGEILFAQGTKTPCDRDSFCLAQRKDKLLWLQVINRAARSVGDKGIESFRMKERCRKILVGGLGKLADKKTSAALIG